MREKLIARSKLGVFFLRCLLLVIPLIVIFSWLFPDNPLSNNLYLGQALGNLIHGDSNTEIGKFIWNNKLLGLLGSAINLSPFLVGLYLLIKLFNNYAKEEIFTIYNARIYSKLGYLCILSSLVFNPLSQILFSLAVSINGHKFIAISADSTNITAIICGVVLITISNVMQLGHKLNEEQNLTI